jgi:hypothetical protein
MKFSFFSFIQFCTFAALIYITLGDAFLPHPYNISSKEVRSNINEYLISLFPNHKLNNLPKNHSNVEMNTFDSLQQAKPRSENSPF